MLRDVKKAGGNIQGVFYCIHKSDQGCACRKPGVGSIQKALKSVNMNLFEAKNSFFVGDTKSDTLTGFHAGLKTILVLSGRADRKQINEWGVKPDFVVKDLFAATKIVMTNNNNKRARTIKRK